MNYSSESTAVWNQQSRILVVGLGNCLLRDDGIGVHAVRSFQRVAPHRCLAAEIGTSIHAAIPMFEGADRILAFNAVEAGGKPGSVYLLSATEILQADAGYPLREMGLMQILQLLQRTPTEVVIIGAEPQCTDWGVELSPLLESVIPVMVSTALEVIAKWQGLSRDDDRKIDLALISRCMGSDVFARTSDPAARSQEHAR